MYQSFSRQGSYTVKRRTRAAISGKRSRSRSSDATSSARPAGFGARRADTDRLRPSACTSARWRSSASARWRSSAVRVTCAVTNGIAVAVAADPAAPAQEAGHDPVVRPAVGRAPASRCRGRSRASTASSSRYSAGRRVEERAAEHVEPGLELVARRGLGRARLLGARERHDTRARARRSSVSRALRAGLARERLEQPPDLGHVIAHGAPARLGRMRGQDRHHEQARELRAHLVGAEPGRGEARQRVGQRVARRVGAVVAAQEPHALQLLGLVHQEEPVR